MTSSRNSTHDEEVDLLRRVARGDEAAFAKILQRHAPYLYGVARSLTGNAADAEDLVQETLLGALKSRFRGESSLRTWLVRILVRQAGMLRRRSWRRTRRLSLSEEVVEEPASQETGAEARLDLQTMLAELSPEHRQVIVLRELEGLSYEEMAEALGVPRGTVESRLHRARQELRTRFKGYL